MIQEHKCITYADFRRINEYAYNQAKKNGWLPELGLIQDNPGRKFWTKEKVFEVARNYSNKTDFRKKNQQHIVGHVNTKFLINLTG